MINKMLSSSIEKIKICFILSHLPQGGAERQTLNLIKNLDREKYEITLFLYSSTDVFYNEVFDIGIKVVEHKRFNSNSLFKSLINAYRIRNFLKSNNFDIIHTLLFHNGFWVRLIAPNYYKNKILYSIRNNMSNCPILFRYFEKYLVKSSIVVTNSLNARKQFIDLVGDKFSQRTINIYNGIDSFKYSPLKKEGNKNKIIIGNVGRQTYQKNQIQILRALVNLENQDGYKFYLIGDKSLDMSIKLESFISEKNMNQNVIILDSQKNIVDYYKIFDIFILSSYYEGCPNSLFEAMLSNCLCIISEGANSDDFVTDRVNGLVYDGSDNMLVKKINEALALLGTRMGEDICNNGRKYVLENLSLSKMISEYENVYSNIIKSNFHKPQNRH